MSSLCSFIEDKLKLKVNTDKSKVFEVRESKFLGYTILNNGILVVSKQGVLRLKKKIRETTRRNRGVSLEQIIVELNQKLRGWLNYFRHAKCHGLVKSCNKGGTRHRQCQENEDRQRRVPPEGKQLCRACI